MKKILIYIFSIIISVFIGIISTYILLNKKSNLQNIASSLVYIEASCNDVKNSGSGFVYKIKDDIVYIITNYHVIEDCTDIYVYNSSMDKSKSNLINYDEYTDIAILKVQGNLNLKSANIGNSDKLKVGEEIYVAGSPLGINYSSTITHGIISYLNRQIQISTTNGNSLLEVIQVDAFINSGNSGGPLLNKNGDVIGLIFVKEENLHGIGFALPINYVMNIVDKLENNEINRPNLGAIMVDSLNSELLFENGIEIDNISGIVVLHVNENGILCKSGIEKGDIITKINDIEFNNISQFQKILYNYNVGDTIKIQYYRNKKFYDVYIIL